MTKRNWLRGCHWSYNIDNYKHLVNKIKKQAGLHLNLVLSDEYTIIVICQFHTECLP